MKSKNRLRFFYNWNHSWPRPPEPLRIKYFLARARHGSDSSEFLKPAPFNPDRIQKIWARFPKYQICQILLVIFNGRANNQPGFDWQNTRRLPLTKITYKQLSRKLQINVNTAKTVLLDFLLANPNSADPIYHIMHKNGLVRDIYLASSTHYNGIF